MQSYIREVTAIIQDSGLSAHVLLSSDNACAFFWPVFTGVSAPPPEMIYDTPVRTIGVAGRTGEHVRMVLNEPLDCGTTERIEVAWNAYCKTVDDLETAELERLFALPDTR
jgi:hypothetical protein